jgi:hypothetical protein
MEATVRIEIVGLTGFLHAPYDEWVGALKFAAFCESADLVSNQRGDLRCPLVQWQDS